MIKNRYLVLTECEAFLAISEIEKTNHFEYF